MFHWKEKNLVWIARNKDRNRKVTRAWQIGNLTCHVGGDEEEDQDGWGTRDRSVVVGDFI